MAFKANKTESVVATGASIVVQPRFVGSRKYIVTISPPQNNQSNNFFDVGVKQHGKGGIKFFNKRATVNEDGTYKVEKGIHFKDDFPDRIAEQVLKQALLFVRDKKKVEYEAVLKAALESL